VSRELLAVCDDRVVGRITQRREGRFEFAYDDAWRAVDTAYPVSLSMPMSAKVHPDVRIRPFLQGLLPDNDAILKQWGRRFGVSAQNPFALLEHVGEDCAGAIQFVSAARFEEMQRSVRGRRIAWLTEADLANRLRQLRADNAAWRLGGDSGYFSLAGAHAKTALLFDGTRWGVPRGRTPTTHILKPPLAGLDGFAENEHVCLSLARALGLPAAHSTVVRFEDEVAIAVERFDRRRDGTRWVRIHQEDCGQALAVPPEIKYQNQGGPGPEAIIELLRNSASQPDVDVWTFVRALVFNWLIAGTDAHAKNYGILIGAGGAVRLAPLYDVASALPYPRSMPPRKLKLAMKIGGEYLVARVARRHWERFAKQNALAPAEVLAVVLELATAMPNAIGAVRVQAEAAGLAAPILLMLDERIAARARELGAL